jgi:hypothetical protein
MPTSQHAYQPNGVFRARVEFYVSAQVTAQLVDDL